MLVFLRLLLLGSTLCGTAASATTDSGGDPCQWYTGRRHLCGCCDDDDFSASHCEECRQDHDRDQDRCTDADDGIVDSFGDGCQHYARIHCTGAWDTPTFKALEMCCICGGGRGNPAQCVDQDNGTVDTWGEGCETYAAVHCTGQWDTATFSARTMCCVCNGMRAGDTGDAGDALDECSDADDGVTDKVGSGCEHYAPHECTGDWDTVDFKATTMCCICGGGRGERKQCADTDNGALDSSGSGCRGYAAVDCTGRWDTASFSALTMCCVCGGGTAGALQGIRTLEEALAGFPAKATAIVLPWKRLSGRLTSAVLQSFLNLRVLDLHGNRINGTLPRGLWALPHLHTVKLSVNQIEGPLEDAVAAATQLVWLDLSSNRLNGSIPEAAGLWRQVTLVNLWQNDLTGPIPEAVGQWKDVETVYLSENDLTGPIPEAVGSWTKVVRLSLAWNRLSGKIPDAVGNWTQLQYLNMGHNSLSGAIPQAVGEWRSLTWLNFEKNWLSGPIPHTVGHWRDLKEVYMPHNELSGPIPDTVGNWLDVTTISLHSNGLSGQIPNAVGEWTQLIWLELQRNSLTGLLPGSVGRWQNVKNVILRVNRLSGPIPAAVGEWRKAEQVDLGGNQFSGSIPATVGNWHSVSSVNLAENHLEGPIPSGALGSWTAVEEVTLDHNRLSGSIPAEVGAWQQVTHINFRSNTLSGSIPDGVGKWTRLRLVDMSWNGLSGEIKEGIWPVAEDIRLSGNNFTGVYALASWRKASTILLGGNLVGPGLADLGELNLLQELDASSTGLSSIGALPASLQRLDLSGNSLTSLPEALDGLVNLVSLNLRSNSIQHWPPRGVRHLSWVEMRDGELALLCNDHYAEDYHMLQPRFPWLKLQFLDVSDNPLGDYADQGRGEPPPLQVFLFSLAQLPLLEELRCEACRLQGGLSSWIGGHLAFEDASLGCESYAEVGLRGLRILSLSRNAIREVNASPPKSLQLADWSSNDLKHIQAAWFNLDGRGSNTRLDLRDNPNLQAAVLPPAENGCSRGVLMADLARVSNASGSEYECFELCSGPVTDYSADETFNITSLCRCRPGFGGEGKSCSMCQLNSYSTREGLCRHCPAGATTKEEGATSEEACLCPQGRYMNGGACEACDQSPYRTTRSEGTTVRDACVCNPNYGGLREVLGVCGCESGKYLNHAEQKCQECSKAEQCQWSAEDGLAASLEPPFAKDGFWAEPIPDLKHFRHNSVWRCASRENCKANRGGEGACLDGRGGRACSLCVPGKFGRPTGPCSECPYSPHVHRWILVALVLALPLLPLLAHGILNARPEDRGLLSTFRSLRLSAKQILKHLQIVSLVGGFSVNWPEMARHLFETLDLFSANLSALLAAACLRSETSAALEMAVKWGVPLAFCLDTLLAVPLSWLLAALARRAYARLEGRNRTGGRLARWLSAARGLGMRGRDVVRVLLFMGLLFHSSLLRMALEMLSCAPSPSGIFTVVSYPHLACFGAETAEWWSLAVISALALLVLAGSLAIVIYLAYCKTVERMVKDNWQRGWYSFLFDDFRDTRMGWALRFMVRDTIVALVPALMPGQGVMQLLSVAALSTAAANWILLDCPYFEMSSTGLEAFNSASTAILCFYTAGMGYQSTTGVDDVEELFADGGLDPIFRARAIGLVIMQGIAVGVPAAIVVYQLVSGTLRMGMCLPPSAEDYEEELKKLRATLVDLDDLFEVAKRFDTVDARHFLRIFKLTSAARFHEMATLSSSRLVRLSSKSLDRRSRGSAEASLELGSASTGLGGEARQEQGRTPRASQELGSAPTGPGGGTSQEAQGEGSTMDSPPPGSCDDENSGVATTGTEITRRDDGRIRVRL